MSAHDKTRTTPTARIYSADEVAALAADMTLLLRTVTDPAAASWVVLLRDLSASVVHHAARGERRPMKPLEHLVEALRATSKDVHGATVTNVTATSGRRINLVLAIETEPGHAPDLVDAVADALGAPAHARYGGGRSGR